MSGTRQTNLFNLPSDIIAELDDEYYRYFKVVMINEKKYRFRSFYTKVVTWILVRESFGDLKSDIYTTQDFKGMYEDYMEVSLTETFEKGLHEFLEDKYGVVKLKHSWTQVVPEPTPIYKCMRCDNTTRSNPYTGGADKKPCLPAIQRR